MILALQRLHGILFGHQSVKSGLDQSNCWIKFKSYNSKHLFFFQITYFSPLLRPIALIKLYLAINFSTLKFPEVEKRVPKNKIQWNNMRENKHSELRNETEKEMRELYK